MSTILGLGSGGFGWQFCYFTACGTTCTWVESSLARQRNSVSYSIMSTVKEIESAVSKLSREELSAFRSWFTQFDAKAWDQQLEQDIAAGRLDRLAEEALNDLREGRTSGL